MLSQTIKDYAADFMKEVAADPESFSTEWEELTSQFCTWIQDTETFIYYAKLIRLFLDCSAEWIVEFESNDITKLLAYSILEHIQEEGEEYLQHGLTASNVGGFGDNILLQQEQLEHGGGKIVHAYNLSHVVHLVELNKVPQLFTLLKTYEEGKLHEYAEEFSDNTGESEIGFTDDEIVVRVWDEDGLSFEEIEVFNV